VGYLVVGIKNGHLTSLEGRGNKGRGNKRMSSEESRSEYSHVQQQEEKGLLSTAHDDEDPSWHQASIELPNQALVHGVLMMGQVVNGAAVVIGKLGLHEGNPILFALVRESLACPIFFGLAYFVELRENTVPLTRTHIFWAIAAGTCLFTNQLFYVTGVKLANSVLGAAWQPSQPIFVMLICMVLGWEVCTLPKLGGVLFALLGGAVMILGEDRASDGNSALLGNIMFFLNCLGTACYVIVSRILVQELPPFTVVAMCYFVATIGIVVALLVVNSQPVLVGFICPGGCELWTIPSGMIFALCIWVLGPSIFCYSCLVWGTKNAKETTYCLAYTALQPLTSFVLSVVLILMGWNNAHPDNQISKPGWNGLGAFGVLIGVALVTFDAYLNAQVTQEVGEVSTTVKVSNFDDKENRTSTET